MNARLVALIAGSSLAATGLGAMLPYLYTDIATTRGLGGAVAALTFIAFALGSLVVSPLSGRLADGRHPVAVASGARALMAVGVLGLGFTTDAVTTLAASALAGIAYALTQPAINVLLLANTPESRTRQVFAAQFVGLNLALAAGGLIAGLTVNLATPAGTRPIYVLAAVAELASAVVVALAGRGSQTHRDRKANGGRARRRPRDRRPAAAAPGPAARRHHPAADAGVLRAVRLGAAGLCAREPARAAVHPRYRRGDQRDPGVGADRARSSRSPGGTSRRPCWPGAPVSGSAAG